MLARQWVLAAGAAVLLVRATNRHCRGLEENPRPLGNCSEYPPPRKHGMAASVATRLKMLAYLQERFVVYLTDGTHLGAIRNGSIIATDGDLDVTVVAHNYSACRGGVLGLAQLLWFPSTLSMVETSLRDGLPDGWHLHKNTVHDFQLSLTPTTADGRCCEWPHVIDIDVESVCRQQERDEMFGEQLCRCYLDNGFATACLRRGELYATCLYGGHWQQPTTCTYDADHPSKPQCTAPPPQCHHLWWYRCPFLPGYKWRHMGSWGEKFIRWS